MWTLTTNRSVSMIGIICLIFLFACKSNEVEFLQDYYFDYKVISIKGLHDIEILGRSKSASVTKIGSLNFPKNSIVVLSKNIRYNFENELFVEHKKDSLAGFLPLCYPSYLFENVQFQVPSEICFDLDYQLELDDVYWQDYISNNLRKLVIPNIDSDTLSLESNRKITRSTKYCLPIIVIQTGWINCTGYCRCFFNNRPSCLICSGIIHFEDYALVVPASKPNRQPDNEIWICCEGPICDITNFPPDCEITIESDDVP